MTNCHISVSPARPSSQRRRVRIYVILDGRNFLDRLFTTGDLNGARPALPPPPPDCMVEHHLCVFDMSPPSLPTPLPPPLCRYNTTGGSISGKLKRLPWKSSARSADFYMSLASNWRWLWEVIMGLGGWLVGGGGGRVGGGCRLGDMAVR